MPPWWRSRRSAEDGFALVSVVMLAALIAALVIGILGSTRRIAYETDRAAAVVETHALGEAGLNRIIAAYLNRGDPMRGPLRPDGRPVSWEFAGHELILSVQAESGKIDVNAGDRTHIEAVLSGLLAAPSAAGFLRRLDEARANHARVHSVASLLSPFERMMSTRDDLERHFTVMTEQRGIDPATAPILTLQALPHLSVEQRARLVAAREQADADAFELPPAARQMFSTERPIYTLRAEARSLKRAGAMRAVVGFDEKGNISVYSWGVAAASRPAPQR